MSHPSPALAGKVLLSALLDLAEEREDVREALVQVSGWIHAHLREPRHGRGDHGTDELPERVLHLRDRRLTRGPDSGLGDERPHRDVHLDRVVARAQWKADACRFVVARRQADGDQREELGAREQELRSRRDPLEDCFAWMLDTYRRLPDDERMEDIAACYENVSRAAAATLELEREGLLEPGPPSELLYLLAESQSALLAALQEVELRGDSDQRDLFLWLKDQTTRHRIYVDRHMRLDDPADFHAAPALARRIEELSRELVARRDARRRRGQLLNRVRYHLRKVVESTPPPTYDVEAIDDTVGQWCEAGLPLGDRTLRSLLASLRESMEGEGDLPPRVQEVLASSPDSAAGSASQDGSSSRPELLLRARSLLGGRRILLFAGPREESACQELQAALGLEEVRWIPLEEEDGVEQRLREEIAADDVSLVLIGLRLQVPDYALFKQLCIDSSKPFVRLPSGYGPLQVAHQVLRQVGRRLRSTLDESSGPAIVAEARESSR